ncbi:MULTISPECIES: DUF6879 family protein [Streptomyces]|uniref:DUF6879 domain-containing protein n=2 Tax=Streptomyces rhizosphaericus TaxID=114699 RepID=A0ABN1SC72_9ACTN|nr:MULTISPECIES: DUF6879 family protein [Streptomyces]EXU67636.1 hypothetical protein Z951_13390 [Streptomyces sp. PRh5]
MSLKARTFADLLAATRHSAVHLEMRDQYAVGDEAEDYAAFQDTGVANTDPSKSFWPEWLPLVTDAVARGVTMRRARIVSEPVTDYIRYEHAITVLNLRAGEDVRWLPRRHASDLALPGNDFWLLDGRLVQFNHFTGRGDWVGKEHTEDPEVAALCAAAFEAVWQRAVPHEKYTV